MTLHNLHIPLNPETYSALREESLRSHIPATVLARQAVEALLRQRERERTRDEISAWATAHAASPLDLDEALEAAGLQALSPDDQ